MSHRNKQKVQAKDLVRFAIDHKGSLKDYLNKPTVDNEKVYAKILLHKTLTEKYNSIRESFANMPVDELLMTRKERIKLKKERNEAIKSKEKKSKNVKKENSESNEDKYVVKENYTKEEEGSDNDIKEGDSNDLDLQSNLSCHDDEENNDYENPSSHEDETMEDNTKKLPDDVVRSIKNNRTNKEQEIIKAPSNTLSEKQVFKKDSVKSIPKIKNKKTTKKPKVQGKDSMTESVLVPAMVVDSFFLTASGDNYMTLAEPRQPDEVKEVHQRGNRKMRRAEMFGKPIRHRKPFNRNPVDYGHNSDPKRDSTSKYEKSTNSKKDSCKDNNTVGNNVTNYLSADKRKAEVSTEKLHPSWEAKKQKSGIVAFQGKKVVF